MLSVSERDRDSLRFLWVTNPNNKNPEIRILWFTRVIFGFSSRPFPFNLTINHHLETYCMTDPAFVETFLISIYVDDLVTGSSNLESAYELYLKSKFWLTTAKFKLQKFITNSKELCRLIQEEESSAVGGGTGEQAHVWEDQFYTKRLLGVKTGEKQGISKDLGVQWDVANDQFQLDFGDVIQATKDLSPPRGV